MPARLQAHEAWQRCRPGRLRAGPLSPKVSHWQYGSSRRRPADLGCDRIHGRRADLLKPGWGIDNDRLCDHPDSVGLSSPASLWGTALATGRLARDGLGVPGEAEPALASHSGVRAPLRPPGPALVPPPAGPVSGLRSAARHRPESPGGAGSRRSRVHPAAGGRRARWGASDPMALLLGVAPRFEAVEFDSPGDGCHAGLAGLAGGEVAGLLAHAGAGPAGAVADEEPRVEDLQQERGQGQVKLVRGEKPL